MDFEPFMFQNIPVPLMRQPHYLAGLKKLVQLSPRIDPNTNDIKVKGHSVYCVVGLEMTAFK